MADGEAVQAELRMMEESGAKCEIEGLMRCGPRAFRAALRAMVLGGPGGLAPETAGPSAVRGGGELL